MFRVAFSASSIYILFSVPASRICPTSPPRLLVQVTSDRHVAKASGQFSILILFDLSAVFSIFDHYLSAFFKTFILKTFKPVENLQEYYKHPHILHLDPLIV